MEGQQTLFREVETPWTVETQKKKKQVLIVMIVIFYVIQVTMDLRYKMGGIAQ